MNAHQLPSNRWPTTSAMLLALLATAGLVTADAAGAQDRWNDPGSSQAGAHADAAIDDDAIGYGFVRTVEGSVTLSGLDATEPAGYGSRAQEAVEAEVNHPLLSGDVLTTYSSGRAEVVLPDGGVIRIDRSSRLTFEALFGSPDTRAGRATELVLDEGEILLRTDDYGSADTTLVAPNAVVYLAPGGLYRVTIFDYDFTEVVVRRGLAEAETSEGSSIARGGELLEVRGSGRSYATLASAGGADELEFWSQELEGGVPASATRHVEPRLRYAAHSLHGNGDWVQYQSSWAWRPYVGSAWRPFVDGRWVYTPSGLTWVASARWGWLTSHYGSWDHVPGYGWMWFPGAVYSPASVYWYWGPTYVGWVPSGYYSRYYGYSGFRLGVYGWAGGPWSYFDSWTFCPTRYFGRRGYDRYWGSGRDIGRRARFAVPRGIVTTDTRGITPDRWGKPGEILGTLSRRGSAVRTSELVRAGGGLPDVSRFVARRDRSDGLLASRLDAGRRGASLRPLAESGTLERSVAGRSALRPSGSAARNDRGLQPSGSRLGRPQSGLRTGSSGTDRGAADRIESLRSRARSDSGSLSRAPQSPRSTVGTDRGRLDTSTRDRSRLAPPTSRTGARPPIRSEIRPETRPPLRTPPGSGTLSDPRSDVRSRTRLERRPPAQPSPPARHGGISGTRERTPLTPSGADRRSVIDRIQRYREGLGSRVRTNPPPSRPSGSRPATTPPPSRLQSPSSRPGGSHARPSSQPSGSSLRPSQPSRSPSRAPQRVAPPSSRSGSSSLSRNGSVRSPRSSGGSSRASASRGSSRSSGRRRDNGGR